VFEISKNNGYSDGHHEKREEEKKKEIKKREPMLSSKSVF
jgi:hypothetical protein